jgi:hypothetical protein
MAALTLLLSRGNGLGKGDFISCDQIIGSWSGDRIVASGNYADSGKFTNNSEENLYGLTEQFEDISESILVVMAKDAKFRVILQESISIFVRDRLSKDTKNIIFGTESQQPQEQDVVLGGKKKQSWRIFNLDKNQKIHAEDFNVSTLNNILASTGVTAALAVLLSDGNGRGGGDLDSEKPVVGSWAGDRIVVCGSLSSEDNLFSSRKFKNVGKEIILALADDSYVRESLMQTLPTKQRKLIA